MSSILTTALSGMRVTQAGLDLVSRNVSNADLPGYTKKTLGQTPVVSGDTIMGVRPGEVNRHLDTFVLRQMWRESSGSGYVNTMSRYFTHLDTALGAPGSPAGLDSLYNSFLGSLEAMTSSPDSFTAREQMLRDAQALTQTLNQTSGEIQQLRQEAERGIANATKRINELLSQIADVNRDIAASSAAGKPPPDLLDIRDRHIGELSRLIDLQVLDRDNGKAALFTQSGALLLDVEPAELVFDERGSVASPALYSANDDERGVGTVKLKSPNGATIDLIKDGSIRSGELAALIELRDVHLVQAQSQLDAFADGMARALSSNRVDGIATSQGDQQGFEIDLSALLPGDRMALNYAVNGVEQQVTFVRVDDPDVLPLSPGDVPGVAGPVVGIDFSGGWASVVDQIETALGATIEVEGLGGGGIRILDDGVAGQSSINALSAQITATGFQEGTGLAFFVDGKSNKPYSASLDGTPQMIGFAERIQVNPALLADNTQLVRFGPDTPIGDATRPFAILERLTQDRHHFGPEFGASANTAYTGTVGGYLQRVVSVQASKQGDVVRAKEAQDVVLAQLEERITRESGVNIDEEMARLIELQTAFQANTRVIQSYREMMAMLMQL